MKIKLNKLSAALAAGGSLVFISLSTLASDFTPGSTPTYYPGSRTSNIKLAKANTQSADILIAMANILQRDTLTQESHDQAFDYLHLAANAGSADANFQLAMMFSDCPFIAQDNDEAERRFSRAAALGHTEAKFVVSHLLDTDFGVGC